MAISKVIENGKVAVLVSPGYGTGWTTWVDYEDDKITPEQVETLLYSPRIVKLVQEQRRNEITEDLCKKILGVKDDNDFYVCVYGARNLVVEWVPEGAEVMVYEHDGYELMNYKGKNGGKA